MQALNKSPDHKSIEETLISENKSADSRVGEAIAIVKPKKRKLTMNLSAKLLVLTIGFVMLSEIFVFVPSVAKFRNDWLTDRLTRARTVLLMSPEVPVGVIMPPEQIEANQKRIEDAMRSFDVVTLAHRKDGRRQLIAMIDEDAGEIGAEFDVIHTGAWQSIHDAFMTLLTTTPRIISISGSPPGTDQLIQVVALEPPLRAAMLTYTRNVMILSLIISVLTAAMVYFALSKLFVRPIARLADSMEAFSKNPEASENIIKPGGRTDELGTAEERLAEMQKDLQGTLSSQKRLASLGLAVSKVNHDLRNILASVQLFSDRLTSLPDPDVQRFAPKLIAGIDRAIGYCESTLVYGSAKEEPPKRQLIRLAKMIKELESLLDLDDHPTVEWRNAVPVGTELDADPEQIFRVLMNLSRNAIKVLEAMEDESLVRRLTIGANMLEDRTRIIISDTGPGVPKRAQEHLFEAFRGSLSKGGTGLGLAIAHEIVTAHGGTIKLTDDDGPGATFEIELPNKGKSIV
ncbi:MAG: HAMP domain-containing sensor histidine kinase [Hyphomicrobiales bacterium]